KTERRSASARTTTRANERPASSGSPPSRSSTSTTGAPVASAPAMTAPRRPHGRELPGGELAELHARHRFVGERARRAPPVAREPSAPGHVVTHRPGRRHRRIERPPGARARPQRRERLLPRDAELAPRDRAEPRGGLEERPGSPEDEDVISGRREGESV